MEVESWRVPRAFPVIDDHGLVWFQHHVEDVLGLGWEATREQRVSG